MRILYIITRAHIGGAQSHVLELIRGLAAANQIAILAGEDGFLCDEAAKLGAASFVLPELTRAISPYRDILATRRMRRIIGDFNPDVVHAHCSKAGLLGRVAARMAGVPAVYTAHGWRFAPGVAWAERLVAWPAEWLGARLGQHLITVSSYDSDLAARFRIAQLHRVTLIHNGISNSARLSRNPGERELKIIMVARFAPPKDPLLLMRALRGLPDHVRVVFLGDGPALAQMQKEAAALGVSERVAFLGNRTNVADFLAVSDLFVLTSNSEGLPISILEALRSGLPVIATDVGGVKDAVLDFVNGRLVPRGDVAALQGAIAALADSPSTRTQMGDAGRRLYEQKFTAEQMVRRTYAIYLSLVKNSRRAPPLSASSPRLPVEKRAKVASTS
jgi:glycosyltransferase involved in cell wall biosynthesis